MRLPEKCHNNNNKNNNNSDHPLTSRRTDGGQNKNGTSCQRHHQSLVFCKKSNLLTLISSYDVCHVLVGIVIKFGPK